MKHLRLTSESVHKTLNIALASATLLSIAIAPTLASGAATDSASTSGVYVTILSPNPNTSLTGVKQIEISAYYESAFGVASLDLVIDGKRLATQKLSSPENRGEISFLVDASTLRSGNHTIVVRATATDAEVSSARSLIVLPASSSENSFKQPDPSQSSDDTSASGVVGVPAIDVLSPAPDSTVAGIVRIKVNAIDPSGKSPYVSLFVDHAFKTLRNFPPYTFDWDTTRLTNGLHTIEVWGYNDAQQVGHADPVKVMVNNPGGRTFERHDLLDAVPTTAKVKQSMPAAHRIAAQPIKTAVSSARVKTVSSHIVMGSTSVKPVSEPAMASDSSDLSNAAKLDRLASISSDGAPLGAASVDETLIAPVLNEKASITSTGVRTLRAAPRVMKSFGHPETVSSPITESRLVSNATYQRLSDTDLNDLDSGSIATEPIAPGAVIRVHNVAKSVTASKADGIAGQPVMAIGELSASSSALKSNKKLIKMASAIIDQSIVTGQEQITAPDVASIKQNAARAVGQISQHTISLSNLTRKYRSDLVGSYEVVVDNQRVNLDRPLQSKGAVMFAPFRQIFESQGGVLNWDNDKQQVRAVSATREILLTIGVKSALVNNEPIGLSAAPYLDMNRTMLPLDFFRVALGAHVSYDAASGHLIIESR